MAPSAGSGVYNLVDEVYHPAHTSTDTLISISDSTFTPLVFSGILYACNGRYHIAYIDCLFLCVTSMTVCGLATVDLSSLTPFQQFLLFAQMCLGSPVCTHRSFDHQYPHSVIGGCLLGHGLHPEVRALGAVSVSL